MQNRHVMVVLAVVAVIGLMMTCLAIRRHGNGTPENTSEDDGVRASSLNSMPTHFQEARPVAVTSAGQSAAGAQEPVVIAPGSADELLVRVLNRDGAPIPDCDVSYVYSRSEYYTRATPVANGYLVAVRAPPKNLKLVMSREGYQARSEDISYSTVDELRRKASVFVLERLGSIVLDIGFPGESPDAVTAYIAKKGAGGGSGSADFEVSMTDPRIRYLLEGTYELCLTVPGYKPVLVKSIRVSNESITMVPVQFEQDVPLRGRLVDVLGEPITNAILRVSGRILNNGIGVEVHSDDSGYWSSQWIWTDESEAQPTPGFYTLSVQADGFSRIDFAGIQSRRELEQKVLELTLFRGAWVSGRIQFGVPIVTDDPTWVSLHWQGSPPDWSWAYPGFDGSGTACASIDGSEFALRALPGTYVLRVASPGMARVVSERIELADGECRDDIVITVTDHEATISGRVVSAQDGSGVYGMSVLLARAPVKSDDVYALTTENLSILCVAGTWPESDGSFVLNGLAAGDYQIIVIDEKLQRYHRYLSPTIHVEAGGAWTGVVIPLIPTSE